MIHDNICPTDGYKNPLKGKVQELCVNSLHGGVSFKEFYIN